MGVKIILPYEESDQDWEGVLGCSRDELIEKILAGGWHRDAVPDAVIYAREESGEPNEPFALRFHEAEFTYVGIEPIRFTIVFNYRGEHENVRLRDVSFDTCQYQGVGARFLAATLDTILFAGARKILVEPGLDGSWYWTNRGALIQKWPDYDGVDYLMDEKAAEIIEKRAQIAPDWKGNDIGELKRVFRERDCFGLNQLIARDDLLVARHDEVVPLRRFLVQNVYMGPCVFDLDHEWTQERLKKRLDFDVKAAIKKYGERGAVPARVVRAGKPASFKSSAPAS